jgi:hypothetical protein
LIYRLDLLKRLKKQDLWNCLIMNYGDAWIPLKYNELLKNSFWDRYINRENPILSSKSRPIFNEFKEVPTGTYISYLDSKLSDFDYWEQNFLKQFFVLKEAFKDHWAWIHFPWSRDIKNDYIITKNGNVNYFVMQEYYDMLKKISITSEWILDHRSVDFRAVVSCLPQSGTFDIEIFAKEWQKWWVTNISHWWSYSKVCVVPDSLFFELNHEMFDCIKSLTNNQLRQLGWFFDQEIKNRMSFFGAPRLSPIPVIISRSTMAHIEWVLWNIIDWMICCWMIERSNEWHIVWNTMIWVDLSCNPCIWL